MSYDIIYLLTKSVIKWKFDIVENIDGFFMCVALYIKVQMVFKISATKLFSVDSLLSKNLQKYFNLIN